MSYASSVQEKLVREILRKLRLANDAELKEDREILCSEVFTDVTGELDELAQERLGVNRRCRFYEVLAPYLNKKWDTAESLLYVCRKLWGQPYVSPIYTLLLHQWLLLNKEAGGTEQRQKHLNVLVSGAKQIFWGDIHSENQNFQPLYGFLATDVVFAENRARLNWLPHQSRAGILTVVATFLPFYDNVMHLDLALEVFPSPDIHPEAEHHSGEGADFVMSMIVEALKGIKAERSLLQYLDALLDLKGCQYLQSLRRSTRLNIQAELYNLTSVGGPRYVSRSVNTAAFRVLDALYPMGQRSRRIVSLFFRLWFHPTEWPRQGFMAVRSSTKLSFRSIKFTYRHTIGQVAQFLAHLAGSCRNGWQNLVTRSQSWSWPWQRHRHES